MSIHPLLSDWFLYLLLIIIIAIAIYQSRRPQLKDTWLALVQSKPAMFSIVILSLFFIIAIMDSIHLQIPVDKRTHSEPPMQSLLDRMAPRLAFATEKTYSRPLDTQMSIPTAFKDEHGQAQYGIAPLQHLTPSSLTHNKHLLLTATTGAAYGLGIFIILGGVTFIFRRYQQQLSWKNTWQSFTTPYTQTAWSALATTLIIVLLTGGACLACASKFHLFGTNRVGEDVFFESLKSIRTGVLIGTLSTLFMLPLAAVFGLLAGFYRGWVDDIIQYVYTTLSSIPGVLLISATILVMQIVIHNHPQWFTTLEDRADARLIALCLILGLTNWANLCRLLRAETMKIKSLDFVQVARVLGVKRPVMMWRHILPNVFHIILITIALDFSGLVLAEAVLSYVGVGVDPTTASWGNIINAARLEMAREPAVWWTLAAAMSMMFLLVLAANLFADALRDALDPRIRSSATQVSKQREAA